MRYKSKKYIDAVTFDELMEHGRQNGANIVNGMPWSFEWMGGKVTHERDDKYFIAIPENLLERHELLGYSTLFPFFPGDVLVRELIAHQKYSILYYRDTEEHFFADYEKE